MSYHSPAAYLASAVNSGLSYEVCRYLHHSVDLYNNLVDPPDSLTSDFVDNSCSSTTQKFLSNKIEDCQFRKLFNNSTPIDRARLLSISSPHASAWLSVTPSPSIGLHLEPSEFQVAIKWWLGIPVAQGQSCTQCNAALDAYGHQPRIQDLAKGGGAVLLEGRHIDNECMRSQGRIRKAGGGGAVRFRPI